MRVEIHTTPYMVYKRDFSAPVRTFVCRRGYGRPGRLIVGRQVQTAVWYFCNFYPCPCALFVLQYLSAFRPFSLSIGLLDIYLSFGRFVSFCSPLRRLPLLAFCANEQQYTAAALPWGLNVLSLGPCLCILFSSVEMVHIYSIYLDLNICTFFHIIAFTILIIESPTMRRGVPPFLFCTARWEKVLSFCSRIHKINL